MRHLHHDRSTTCFSTFQRLKKSMSIVNFLQVYALTPVKYRPRALSFFILNYASARFEENPIKQVLPLSHNFLNNKNIIIPTAVRSPDQLQNQAYQERKAHRATACYTKRKNKQHTATALARHGIRPNEKERRHTRTYIHTYTQARLHRSANKTVLPSPRKLAGSIGTVRQAFSLLVLAHFHVLYTARSSQGRASEGKYKK